MIANMQRASTARKYTRSIKPRAPTPLMILNPLRLKDWKVEQ